MHRWSFCESSAPVEDHGGAGIDFIIQRPSAIVGSTLLAISQPCRSKPCSIVSADPQKVDKNAAEISLAETMSDGREGRSCFRRFALDATLLYSSLPAALQQDEEPLPKPVVFAISEGADVEADVDDDADGDYMRDAFARFHAAPATTVPDLVLTPRPRPHHALLALSTPPPSPRYHKCGFTSPRLAMRADYKCGITGVPYTVISDAWHQEGKVACASVGHQEGKAFVTD